METITPNVKSPGRKAAETKGPIERKRAARMAAWTRKHGKDDAKNPHSRQNAGTLFLTPRP
jgi:hypothetical protein